MDNDEAATTVAVDNKLPAGLSVLKECLEQLKLVTKRYSKKQTKWIKNRFLASKDRQVPDIYQLDTSDIGQWNEAVYLKAVDLIDSYKNNQVSEVKAMEKITHLNAGCDEEVKL